MVRALLFGLVAGAVLLPGALSVADAAPKRFGPFVVDSDQPSVIRLDGQIGALDQFSFDDARDAAPNARTLMLDSPGGNLIIALGIADRLLQSDFKTVIPQNSVCLSACAFLFLAGREREVEGRLGVHQVASTDSGDFAFAQAALSRVARFLQKADTNPEILAIMLATPADQMHIFDRDEITRFGLDRGGRSPGPVERPTPQPEEQRPQPKQQPEAPVLTAAAEAAFRACAEVAASPFDAARPAGVAGVGNDQIDASRAIPACQKALDLAPGDARVESMLGRSLQRAGRDQEAVAMFRKAAEQQNAFGEYSLGLSYAYGRGVGTDNDEAARWYRLAADRGYVEAQYNLAIFYANGTGVPQDGAAAADWYRRAAEQGYPAAQSNLGLMLAYGTGVPKDEAAAARWYKLAVDQGYSNAQYGLGLLYHTGAGVPKNDVEALRLFRLAAEQEDTTAQYQLGLMYATGDGVPKDPKQAERWYRRSAAKGYSLAQYALGYMFKAGGDAPKNDAEGLRFLRLAADQGYAPAQYYLGNIFLTGDGVAKDQTEAVRWYRKAAEQGDDKARDILQRLGKL
ncbi:SEL1-like repeat protein [Jiella sonneratiae]|uniref:SEL1-like repeat protein n=1 Tax=Jiella sonneratiae TaxID=2816856 RepID=A0ABS3IZE2_9HYPH|nr:SEL1-like repeat protein [Jiella sonneratiae]